MEFLTIAGSWVAINISQLLQIIGAFAIIATWTVNKSDDKIVQFLLDVVNFLGANLGNAKNK